MLDKAISKEGDVYSGRHVAVVVSIEFEGLISDNTDLDILRVHLERKVTEQLWKISAEAKVTGSTAVYSNRG